MGELKDWLTMAGAITAAVISAVILIRLKRSDREAERRKTLREKLEAAYNAATGVAQGCSAYAERVRLDVPGLGAGPPLVPPGDLPVGEFHKLDLLIRFYFKDLMDQFKDFGTAYATFFHHATEVHLGEPSGGRTPGQRFTSEMRSAQKELAATYRKLVDRLAEKADALI